MATKNLFITGASGVIGRYVLANLDFENFSRIFVLVRENSDKLAGLNSFLIREAQDKQINRIKILGGDITKDRLGFDNEQYVGLTRQVTHILHCAADTRFSQELAGAVAINVGGTRHVLNLAYDCKSLQAFGHLSTVYVSGKRQGLIKEDELEDRGFVNSYEQSKFEAEKFLRGQWDKVPIAIYRLSTAIGDSRDGLVPGFNSIHKALRLYFAGLAPMIPGIPHNIAELLDVCYATRAVSYLFNERFKAQKTYHIIAGKKYSYTLEELIDETSRFFGQYSPAWKNKRIEKPPIVTPETFALFEKSVYQANDRVMMEIIKIMKYFVPHLSLVTTYDTTNADNDLDDAIKKKHIRQYYGKIINYCIRRNWQSL